MWQFRVATKYIFSEASRPSKFDASAADRPGPSIGTKPQPKDTGRKIRIGTGPVVLIG